MITMQVTIDSREAEDMLNKVMIKLPIEMGNAASEFAKQVATELIIGASNNVFTGDLIKSIRAERLSKNRSVVKMKKRGIYLDRMRPHYVGLFPGRKITVGVSPASLSLSSGRGIKKWAEAKFGKSEPTRVSGKSRVWYGPRGGMKGAIYVTPHPFIDAAYSRVFPRLDGIVRGYAGKALAESV